MVDIHVKENIVEEIDTKRKHMVYEYIKRAKTNNCPTCQVIANYCTVKMGADRNPIVKGEIIPLNFKEENQLCPLCGERVNVLVDETLFIQASIENKKVDLHKRIVIGDERINLRNACEVE